MKGGGGEGGHEGQWTSSVDRAHIKRRGGSMKDNGPALLTTLI